MTHLRLVSPPAPAPTPSDPDQGWKVTTYTRRVPLRPHERRTATFKHYARAERDGATVIIASPMGKHAAEAILRAQLKLPPPVPLPDRRAELEGAVVALRRLALP